jgi:predicted metal-dependent phosphoesterase TrpH
VVQEAARAGLAAVGITDHDTINGVEAAVAEGNSAGIIVVPGVEINTDFEKTELHVLGYFVDYGSVNLNAHLQYLRDQRVNRGRKIVERLKEVGVNIDFERVNEIADGGAVGRPHVARALVEAGYVSSTNAAFGKYLVRGTPGYVERYRLTPYQAIDIILEAGGVPVLAHPGNSNIDEVIPELVNSGLRGIEAYHTDHSTKQSKHYRKLAKQYRLIVTGGSDYHGPNMLKMTPIGHVTVDVAVVEELHKESVAIRAGSNTV